MQILQSERQRIIASYLGSPPMKALYSTFMNRYEGDLN
jgi:hypothetical protein